jgi:hypothetical protein
MKPDDLAELKRLAELGRKFDRRGRCPGYLHRHVAAIVSNMPRPTFAALLSELRYEAVRRSVQGEAASPIEEVDQGFEVLKFHDPKHGRRQVTFKHLKNLLTICKKENPDIR